MTRINCSRMALARLGLTDIGVPPPSASSAALGSWYSHIFPFAGRLVFIFMNERTLLSFLIFEGQRLSPPEFMLAFAKGQDQALRLLGMPSSARNRLSAEAEVLALSPQSTPKARAQANALIEDYRGLVPASGPIRAATVDRLIREVNSRPRKALGWATSAEVARELLSTAAA